jgi:CTP synthase (UTP-ammonia lyase)
MTLQIAIVADHSPSNPNHRATELALQHSAAQLGIGLAAVWWPTECLLEPAVLAEVARADGIVCATGSPYRSLAGALAAIELARVRRIPFLGTCGGFQHAVLEYARNVAGLPHAAHAEYGGDGQDALIAPLSCSLAGQSFEVTLARGSRVEACYGTSSAREHYFCSYGINPRWLAQLLQRGLPIVGSAEDGTPRILELAEHPFFVATLFVPQARSTAELPHPIVTGFVRAAAELSGALRPDAGRHAGSAA